MSFGEFYHGFSQLGGSFIDQMDRAEQRSAASRLGDQLQSGDYGAAASTAFKAGDVNTGLNLLKLGLGQTQAQQANAAFGGLGSLYGGADAGAPGALPRLGQSSTGGAPSFLDQSGPQGDYLASLFKRESGGNPNAQARTSSARGLGQFTTGTWNATARAHPELGLTPVAPGQDGRTDPNQMIAATKALTSDNEGILSRAGLPVNDATRYALHFLGAGGGPRLVAGAMHNPDAPASSYADPKAVAANRNVFFNRDGSPKSAGQVLGDFQRSFGGGGRQQAAIPQAPVQVASLDPSVGVSSMNPAQRPMQMPGQPSRLAPSGLGAARPQIPANAAAGYQPPGGPSDAGPPMQPQIAQAPRPASMVGQPPPAEIGVDANILNAPMRTAGVAKMAQAAQLANAVPPGLSGSQGRGPIGPAPAQEQAPAPPMQAVPTLGGASTGRTMSMPGADGAAPSPEARAQVSAQAPQHLAQAGLPAQVAAPIGQMAPGSSQRVQYLLRLSGLPGLSEGLARTVSKLLENELEQTKMPDDVKQYMFARGQGFTGSLVDYKNELRKPLTPTTVSPGQAVFAPGERTPFYVAPRADDTKLTNVPAGTTVFDPVTRQPVFTAPDREKLSESEKIAQAAEARRAVVQQQGLDPADPRVRDFIVSGNLPKENQQQLTAGDRKAINDAEDHSLLLDQTLGTLARAKELNTQTYTGAGAGVLGRTGTSFPGAGLILDPKKAEATREFNQIMSMEAIKAMSSTLKGATTDREMDRFVEVLGDPATPPDIRGRTIDRMLTLAQRQKDLAQARIGQMREGTYYRPGGGALTGSPPQAAARGGQSGAPALPAPSPSNRPGAVSPADRFGQLVGSGMSKAQAFERLQQEGY